MSGIKFGKKCILKKDKVTTKNCEFVKGEELTFVRFGRTPENQPIYSLLRFETSDGKALLVRISKGHEYFVNFPKPPTLKTMEKWMHDGIAKTIGGDRCEPDGDVDGMPSWLMVLGLI